MAQRGTSRYGGRNRIHHALSLWAAQDVQQQPILCPHLSSVMGSVNTHPENSPEWVQVPDPLTMCKCRSFFICTMRRGAAQGFPTLAVH